MTRSKSIKTISRRLLSVVLAFAMLTAMAPMLSVSAVTPTTIYDVEITSVDAPKVGFALDNDARCAQENLTTDAPEITWKVNGVKATETIAAANTVYTAEVELNLNLDPLTFTFDENVEAEVNGQSASVQFQDDRKITVQYTFAATGDEAALFDNCMGTKTSEKPSYVKGSKYTVHDSVEYKFGGWFTEPNGMGEEKTAGFETGNTYYAKWISDYNKTVVTTTLDFKSNSNLEVPSGTGITWDSASNTLTLNNATIDTVESKAVTLPAGAISVNVAGNSTISSIYDGQIPYFKEDDAKGANYITGIFCAGELTIAGDNQATLNVSSGNITDTRILVCNTSAIWAKKKITIKDITLNAKSGDANSGGGYSCGYSMAIFGKTEIAIDNATVTATSGNGGSDDHNGFSMGIHSLNSLTVTDSTVTATGGNAAQDSAGIFAGPDYGTEPTSYGENNEYLAHITITGSTVTAKGGDADNFTTNGIYAHNKMYITDSTVTASNGKGVSANTSAAIYRNEDLVIDNSTVVATGFDGGIDTYANANIPMYYSNGEPQGEVVLGKTIIKNGSNVTATSLNAESFEEAEKHPNTKEYQPALTACNKLTISDSTLTCYSGSSEKLALMFFDPENDVVDGLDITGSGKIVTDGTVAGFIKKSDTEFEAYNLGNSTDRNYFVTGSETTRLNGTTNIVSPKSGQEMVISLKEINSNNTGAKTNTGDYNNMALFAILAILALCGAGFVYKRREN